MPGFHSFTGCDYTPAFSGRGKLRPLNILQQHKDIQQAFISVGKEDTVSDEAVLQLEKFVCKMYGCRNSRSVDEARQTQFFCTYKPQKNKSFLSAKCISSISMPPCSKVAYQPGSNCTKPILHPYPQLIQVLRLSMKSVTQSGMMVTSRLLPLIVLVATQMKVTTMRFLAMKTTKMT